MVDASLAAKWLLDEDNSDRARALARKWAADGTLPVAPYLLPIEVANVLHRRVVRGDLSLEMAVRLVETLLSSGVELREFPQIHVRALELADELGQGAVYDSHWLRAWAVTCGPRTRGSSGQQPGSPSQSAGLATMSRSVTRSRLTIDLPQSRFKAGCLT